MIRIRSLILLCCYFVAACSLHAESELILPTLSARINDTTETLSKEQIQELENILADFEAKKGAQVALLIVSTTLQEPIEQYSIRVLERSKLGRKGVDDGVLLLVAKDDRQVRIEVGYGLEGVLTDLQSKRIIDQIIVPRFKQGEYYAGIKSGLNAIIAVVNGEELPAARSPEVTDAGVMALFIAFFVGLNLAAAFQSALPRSLASALGGFLTFIIGALGASVFLAILLALFVFVLSTLKVGPTGSGFRGTRSRFGRSSSGSSFGGFSMGGGSFGGGGASGRW
jgi:uncharacterized protein